MIARGARREIVVYRYSSYGTDSGRDPSRRRGRQLHGGIATRTDWSVGYPWEKLDLRRNGARRKELGLPFLIIDK